MKTSCTEIDRKLWLYIDRELAANELAMISRHLRECEPCSSLYHERVCDARLYRSAFAFSPFGDKFVGKLRRQMLDQGLYGASGVEADVDFADAEALPASPRRAVQVPRRGFFPFHRGRTRRLVTVAAMLFLIPIIVLVGHFSNGPTQELLGEVQVEEGHVVVASEGEMGAGRETEVAASRPQPIYAGMVCRVAAAGRAVVNLLPSQGDGASRLSLVGPAVVIFDASATRGLFQARLEAGRLRADVAHRAPGEQFRIETPHARASVIGTSFDLVVRALETSLEVREGKVRFQDVEALSGEGEAEVTPEAGMYVARSGQTKLIAAQSRDLVPHRIEPPAVAAPAASAPATDAPATSAAPSPPVIPPVVVPESPVDDLDSPVDVK